MFKSKDTCCVFSRVARLYEGEFYDGVVLLDIIVLLHLAVN